MDSTLLALLQNPETPTWVLREACMDAQLRSVWAVQYYGGEYSDRFERHIGVFLDRTQAEKWLMKVEEEYEQKRKWYNELDDSTNPEDYDLHWKLKSYDVDERCPESSLESCPLVSFSTHRDYLFRIIEIPLRVEE